MVIWGHLTNTKRYISISAGPMSQIFYEKGSLRTVVTWRNSPVKNKTMYLFFQELSLPNSRTWWLVVMCHHAQFFNHITIYCLIKKAITPPLPQVLSTSNETGKQRLTTRGHHSKNHITLIKKRFFHLYISFQPQQCTFNLA